ncbi:hypothetical protein RRG08_059011 [Elysia crispata]|uniref:Uncharacterized protein n=1 Tax=Elysia crispata TaxID=231223 RepID=A0AAE1DLD8_9GAST|nr:hypothetical protein RRG08_059011 [Elysia crispata]
MGDSLSPDTPGFFVGLPGFQYGQEIFKFPYKFLDYFRVKFDQGRVFVFALVWFQGFKFRGVCLLESESGNDPQDEAVIQGLIME